MKLSDIVGDARDDMFDLLAEHGWMSPDFAENRAVFRGIHLILARRLAQAAREARDEERRRQLDRLMKVSKS